MQQFAPAPHAEGRVATRIEHNAFELAVAFEIDGDALNFGGSTLCAALRVLAAIQLFAVRPQ
jgi:hypothetical protein